MHHSAIRYRPGTGRDPGIAAKPLWKHERAAIRARPGTDSDPGRPRRGPQGPARSLWW